MSSRTFVDRARVFVRAGKGGNGANSFAHDRVGKKSWPDGGPGGKGGDVIFRATPHLQTLLDFQYRQHFSADKGTHGSGNQRNGRNGFDTVVEVPAGTVVFSLENGEKVLCADLVTGGQSACVAKGGAGGKGNSRNLPAEPGQPGEERTLLLELKLLAEAGLIGYPNAGKSTLLSSISRARPKVAEYPFTTLIPHLGVVETKEQPFTVADIPGLIKGAHEGKGLGDEFLRHVERTKVLILVLDMAATEGRDPYEDYRILKKELEMYQKPLLKRKRLVAANKMDLPGAKENLAKVKRRIREKIYPISAKEKIGLEELIEAIVAKLKM
ncbi:MAG: GTPase ObgE [Candidatus Omnitrophica bacterium]|nr:GTPase ObgE [Candidatus Omnitrophota bacterium]